MNFEQLQFCLDTVKKGDSLLICYRDYNSVKREYNHPTNITRENIFKIVEMLTTPKTVKEHKPCGFYSFEVDVEKEPTLIRMHKNKFYDMYGNKVEVSNV